RAGQPRLGGEVRDRAAQHRAERATVLVGEEQRSQASRRIPAGELPQPRARAPAYRQLQRGSIGPGFGRGVAGGAQFARQGGEIGGAEDPVAALGGEEPAGEARSPDGERLQSRAHPGSSSSLRMTMRASSSRAASRPPRLASTVTRPPSPRTMPPAATDGSAVTA